MRKLALTIATGALLASGAHADWLLNNYATVSTDSSVINATYGIQSFSNPASTTSVAVPEAGYIRLVGTKVASTGTEGYTANIGMLHPLKKDWSSANLTGLTSISFDMRYSVKPSDGVEVGFGSKLIPETESNAGHTYTAKVSGSLLPAAANTWKTVVLSVDDFTLPSWWVDAPGTVPELVEVLTAVEQLQFSPKTAYTASGTQAGSPCTKCVTPTTTAINLDIRNITLIGVEATALYNPLGEGCEPGGSSFTLDDFADGDNVNNAGGYWYAFSDTGAAPLDSARGSSIPTLDLVAGDVDLGDPGIAKLSGKLSKTVPGASFTFRPYSGWVAIGTGFEGESSLNLPTLTGISFSLSATKLGPNVKGITFKAAVTGVGDAYTHQGFIPARQITVGSADYQTSVCAGLDYIKQADWVKAPNLVAFDPTKLAKLSWEAKIDGENPANALDTAAFTITNIRFHGVTAEDIADGVKSRVSRLSFGASYRDGILSIQRVEGVQSVSVVSASGKVLAKFTGSSKALRLDRGTYFVVAKKADGKVLSRKLAVMN